MPVKVTFRPNRAGVTAAGRSESVYRELERRANRVIALAQATAPVRTGHYRGSFVTERTRVRGAAAVTVSNTAHYAAILEYGSRPHVIEPKDKQALAWPGGRHPVKKVHHPGTAAQHIMRNALRAAGR
ncbi:HK97 gp10 family phage protein [Micromonosporaceae bacterium Da 78-11]